MDRRDFLKATVQTGAAVALGGTAVQGLTSCGAAAAPDSTPSVTAGSDNLALVKFSDFPNLKNVNGSYKVNIVASSGTQTVFVTRVDASTAKTVSRICTHQGCTLGNWSGSQYACPCHGSTYDSNGNVTNGPSVTALASFSSTITGDGIEVLMT